LFLSLTLVRAVIERGELKDGLQDVSKGDNYPGRNFSLSGKICLHQRDISILGQ
jgi:hypothetical protein